jgi:hypothetical protein
VFDHLQRLTRGPGLFEHADHAEPRPEHGYCLDDVARALVVACREPDPTPAVQALGRTYLDFTLRAIAADGRCHNRMRTDGTWADDPAPGDWWGLGPRRRGRARADRGVPAAGSGRVPPGRRGAAVTLPAGRRVRRPRRC